MVSKRNEILKRLEDIDHINSDIQFIQDNIGSAVTGVDTASELGFLLGIRGYHKNRLKILRESESSIMVLDDKETSINTYTPYSPPHALDCAYGVIDDRSDTELAHLLRLNLINIRELRGITRMLMARVESDPDNTGIVDELIANFKQVGLNRAEYKNLVDAFIGNTIQEMMGTLNTKDKCV
jgi:hypothetical protein